VYTIDDLADMNEFLAFKREAEEQARKEVKR